LLDDDALTMHPDRKRVIGELVQEHREMQTPFLRHNPSPLDTYEAATQIWREFAIKIPSITGTMRLSDLHLFKRQRSFVFGAGFDHLNAIVVFGHVGGVPEDLPKSLLSRLLRHAITCANPHYFHNSICIHRRP
jgi:hypothetical protein